MKGKIMLAAMVAALLVGGCDSPSGIGVGGPRVTLSSYNQLTNGMGYFDAVGVIGFQGEELSRSRMDGVPGVMSSVDTVMYQWINADGSNMNAMFQNDRLVSKAQFGLR